ncbi:MAG: hypothetical protein VW268_15640 [Rhodospirillaceae bacterium]
MDDPKEIATYLIQEYGLDAALQAAVKGTTMAHIEDDNYSLSIWREVKVILRGHSEPKEAEPEQRRSA